MPIKDDLKRKQYLKAYNAKRNADPEHLNQQRDRRKAHRLKNPGRYKKHLEKQRQYDKDRYANNEEYRAWKKRRYRENPEYREAYLARSKQLRSEKTTWPVVALRSLKVRARKYGLPINITAEDIKVPDICPVLGTPIVFGGGNNNPNGPSVDRMIPWRGYVKGNVQVISNRANTLKNDCSDGNEMQKIADYIKRCQQAQDSVVL